MKKKSFNKFKDLVVMALSLGVFFVIWELFVKYSDISAIVLVAPSEILPVITNNYDTLLKELKYTSEEVLYGWFWGNLLALLTSIIIFSYKKISDSVISLGVIVNAVPLIALAAILGGFIGTDQNAKTVIVAILCFFPMLIVATTAFKRVNGDFKRLFDSYNSSKKITFIKLIFPASLPAIFTVLKLNVVNAITTAIVSEFFGAHGGIGQFILARKGFYDLPMVWAGIFFIVISGSLFYFSIEIIKKLFIKWN
ncbi:ABC transporter permease subunit [Candidatus Dojkabacteria bacterium]|uniref:ABC transporter permease subunit n=1 Tax=Candidatus Dojkabacteria bacterium TaxID=2099670 RepID=A0A955I753_9BACT|nr:ABC transporter permease subunit [Candidatus Dojkabacteria bacterium]